MLLNQKSPSVYSVSRLNKEIRQLLERNFASITITGEISNFVSPSSGHWYFTVKDDHAQIRAAMWRGNNQAMRFKPKNGDQVQMQARISLYEPRGDYQLIVEQMEPAGEGALKLQFEALKMQLASEGLFSASHKKPLPNIINKVGIITSATGAAVKDILTVLQRRAPQLEIVIYPAQVQGNTAHQQLIEKISLANSRKEVDVIILGRGGGSLEDLWCFNNESLARAIFASQIPIVSAVGHEIDFTISDYVADIRAATPSAAAELVSPNQAQLFSLITQQKQALFNAFKHYLAIQQRNAVAIKHRLSLCHPQSQLQQKSQRLDELSINLEQAIKQKLLGAQKSCSSLNNRLMLRSPNLKLQQSQHQLNKLKTKLETQLQQQLKQASNTLALQAARLNSVSPLTVLARGYSITKNEQGQIINSILQIKPDSKMTTTLIDGDFTAQILEINSK